MVGSTACVLESRGTKHAGAKLTYDAFLLFPDDGQRHELIAGEHYVTPSTNVRHQELLRRLVREFVLYQETHPEGRLFFAPLDCVLTNVDIVEPDLLLVAEDQLHILADKHVRGAPALVVEISSAATRRVDEVTKRRLYERVGVREYWIVDPDANRLAVYRRGGDGAFGVPVMFASREDVLTTPLLPDFRLPLPELFRR